MQQEPPPIVQQFYKMFKRYIPGLPPLERFEHVERARIMPTKCYSVAMHKVLHGDALYYVEGMVLLAGGVPVFHAWYVDAQGVARDDCIDNAQEYWGVRVPAAEFKQRLLAAPGLLGPRTEFPYHFALQEAAATRSAHEKLRGGGSFFGLKTI